jgi:hypothetical protein
MNLEFYKKSIVLNTNDIEVLIWKFKDEFGNIFVTETPIDGTEEEAMQIIQQGANESR